MPGIAALYSIVAGPWGPIHVAASDRGLVAIDLLTPTDLFVAALERRLRGGVALAHASVQATEKATQARRHVGEGERRLRSFLGGDPAAFDGAGLDVDDRPAWDRAVLGAVREIPWGHTASYGSIARVIGRPGAARAVGGAVGRNPVSLAIPCHRVIAGDGTLGGYGGGWWGSRELRLGVKRELLAREGVVVTDRASGAAGAR
jgi:O-6-methylguanine DNA methyltransferase